VKHYVNVREIVRKASGESLHLKPYEADIRHLLDTYVQADEPRKISPFDDIGLLDLIVKTGIADAIASQLGGMKGSKDAIAETIENNVRARIIQEQTSDPAFYDRMSTLLDEIIRLRKERAIEYEEYLKRIALIAKQVKTGHGQETPATLDTPGKRALYNNISVAETEPDGRRQAEDTAPYADLKLQVVLAMDQAIKRVRHHDWRGVMPREQIIKGAMFDILKDENEVERIFLIVKQQPEY
jgi:type I restriction enzyme R subunit